MNEIKPAYVTFEQSKWLKEKEFDECTTVWRQQGNGISGDVEGKRDFYNRKGDVYTALPEQWQVIEWALKVHNCFIQVISFNSNKQMKFKYQLKRYEWDGSVTDDVVYDTPNQAYEKGISHFLTII